MGLRINSNIEALNAYRNLTNTAIGLSKSMEKLSSGLRINRAADDAAGLAISEKLNSQVRGLFQAQRNAQDGISLIQTAEGALTETQSILQRMRELSVQAANDTLTADDRNAIKSELDSLLAEVDRIANNTEFNTKTLLNGSFGATSLTFQVGANKNQAIAITIGTATTAALTINAISVGDVTAANASISLLDDALKAISTSRASLGAVQNRLEHTIANLGVASENLQAANSRIRDVDMAQEMMTFSKFQILQQAGTAMLAQANMMPQAVLQLIGR
ncbi:MAG: flagellin FliC [Firmicutes bacterium]|nr:flagellin FliC [Bacillota bacterium]MCL5040452.1 flagellin FliC [Bacillota bacterium]